VRLLGVVMLLMGVGVVILKSDDDVMLTENWMWTWKDRDIWKFIFLRSKSTAAQLAVQTASLDPLLCIQERKFHTPRTRKRRCQPRYWMLKTQASKPSQPCPGPGFHCCHPANHPWARPFR
jgi:hypothetical protein